MVVKRWRREWSVAPLPLSLPAKLRRRSSNKAEGERGRELCRFDLAVRVRMVVLQVVAEANQAGGTKAGSVTTDIITIIITKRRRATVAKEAVVTLTTPVITTTTIITTLHKVKASTQFQPHFEATARACVMVVAHQVRSLTTTTTTTAITITARACEEEASQTQVIATIITTITTTTAIAASAEMAARVAGRKARTSLEK
mmetsp:Transcript_28513/g.72688  ORF Transcript_28513/g.72688 Transcript_28513/m.72688 type:complete len:201 (+) Transcript_28513:642-1244(+)